MYVPAAEYSISNNRCKRCRARYDRHRWSAKGAERNASRQSERKSNPLYHATLLTQEAARRSQRKKRREQL